MYLRTSGFVLFFDGLLRFGDQYGIVGSPGLVGPAERAISCHDSTVPLSADNCTRPVGRTAVTETALLEG